MKGFTFERKDGGADEGGQTTVERRESRRKVGRALIKDNNANGCLFALSFS